MEPQPNDYLEYLFSLPQPEYQQELGRLLVAVIDLACERESYAKKLEKEPFSKHCNHYTDNHSSM